VGRRLGDEIEYVLINQIQVPMLWCVRLRCEKIKNFVDGLSKMH